MPRPTEGYWRNLFLWAFLLNDIVGPGSSKKEDARCPYLSKEHVKRENFRESVHAIVRDIEEIVQMGKRHKSCPYYGTRDALRPSQVNAKRLERQPTFAQNPSLMALL